MNIPEQIKLGGHTIKVEYLTTACIINRGFFNSYHNLIVLEREVDTPNDNLMECFLHEIIEAINLKYGLSIDHTVLTVLSEMLFQVLKDNQLKFYSELKKGVF